jgi:N-acetylglucosamine-6-phosphate deacetylase
MSPSRNDPSIAKPHAVLADRVFDGYRWHAEAAVLIRDGRVVGLAAAGEVPAGWPQVRVPAGAFLAPGFIDLQVNGGGGVLLNDQPTAEGMRAIAEAHRRFGTTGCLPTLITDPPARRRAVIAAARSMSGQDGILGLHLEGPFISPRRPGVHPPDRIAQPRAGDLEELSELAGIGRSLVTLAPECVPAGFVRSLASAVRNAVRLAGLPLDDALRAASLTPARFLGLDNERGALVAGARADMVALTEEFGVLATWLAGRTDQKPKLAQ